ncbi:uncharacterized protein [Amphiura filiformis]|uniref:uncharacterized protein n=1 Tax=Amphiura filiformis TaxID=82378 RepID=UPI003B228D33
MGPACSVLRSVPRLVPCRLHEHELVVYQNLADSSSVSWICCQCGLPNFSSSLFSRSDIELSNSFSCLSPDCDSITSEFPSSPLASSSPTSKNKGYQNPRPRPTSKPKRTSLKILVVNFQGIRNKTADLSVCIDEKDPDIIIGSETHLNDLINSSELFPPNFTVFRKDRDFGPAKGGVLIATKNDLIATHRVDLDSNCEAVWVSIELQGAKQITIGSFYRSQQYGNTTEYFDQLQESLRKASKNNNSQIYLAGDFNLPDVDWPTQSIPPGSQYVALSNHMLDISAEFGLEQMVTEPTRIKNILDLFFTTNSSLVESSTVIPGISDHDGIPLIVVNSKPITVKPKPRKVYSYHKADVSAIKSDLLDFSNYLTSSENTNSTVEGLYTDFENKIKDVMDAHVPARMVTKKNLTPWIGKGIKRLHRRKQRAYPLA